MTKEDNSLNSKAEKLSKIERVPISKQKMLTAGQRPGYVRRYVNDLPGRIDMFKKAGWIIVSDENNSTYDGQAHVESQMGSLTKRVVNRGPNADCRYAVLMEIPEEYYNADKAEQQKLIDEKETSFDRNGVLKAAGNRYGPGMTKAVDNRKN